MQARPLPLGKLGFFLLVLAFAASISIYWARFSGAVRALRSSSPDLRPKVLTDLYPIWYGTRALLLDHRDPYSAAVRRELQIAYYGKELDSSKPRERLDQQGFAYPIYLVFFVAYLAQLQFHSAQTVFRILLIACAASNLALWIRFLRLRLSPLAMAACFVLTMTSIPILQNLSILQPFLLPACFLAAAAAATSSGRLFVAGSLSGLATIKPQVALLPLAWLALWVGVDWRRRISFAWGFAITLAILLLASLWLLPGWLSEYPGILRAYAGYTQAHSLLSAALPPPLSWLVGVALGFVVGQVCWRARRQPPDSPAFAIALASVLALTVVTVPSMAQPFNQVLLLPTILLTLQHWQRLRQTSRATRMLASMLCLCLFLPWLLSPVAIANPFDPQRDRLDNLWALPLASDILLPFAAFCALMLLQKVTLVREGSK